MSGRPRTASLSVVAYAIMAATAAAKTFMVQGKDFAPAMREVVTAKAIRHAEHSTHNGGNKVGAAEAKRAAHSRRVAHARSSKRRPAKLARKIAAREARARS